MNGVSTRKIQNIAKWFRIESLSASEISEKINSRLEQTVDEFRSRKLDAEYPVIWVDTLYEKIRNNQRLGFRGNGFLHRQKSSLYDLIRR